MDKFGSVSSEIGKLIRENNDEGVVNKYLELKEYVENNYHKCDEYYKLLLTICIEIVKYSVSFDKELAKAYLDYVKPFIKYGDNKNKYDYYTYSSLFDEEKKVYYLKKALKYSDEYGAYEVYDALFEHSLNADNLADVIKYGNKLLDIINRNDFGYEKRTDIALCVALSYISLESYKKALKYLFKALDYVNYSNNKDQLYRIYDNIGFAYEGLLQANKALQYYIIAFDYAKKLDNDKIIKALISIIECADYNDNFSIELTYLKKLSKYLEGERLFINKCRIFSVELKLLGMDALKRKIKILANEYEEIINDNTALHFAIACLSYYRSLCEHDYNTDFYWLKKAIETLESIEAKNPDAYWFLIKSYCLYGNNEFYAEDKKKKYLIGINIFENVADKLEQLDCYDIYNTYLNLIDICKLEEAEAIFGRLAKVLDVTNPDDKNVWLASGYFHLSDLCQDSDQKCIDYHLNAIELLSDDENRHAMELLFEIYTSLSYVYESIEETNLAIEVATKNVELSKKLDELYISDAYNQLSYYYDLEGDFETEKKIFEEEIDVLSEFSDNQLYLADVYSKYASLLNYDLSDNYLSIKYYEMSIKIFLDHNIMGEFSEKIADQYFGLATCYWEMNDGEESLANYFRSLEYLDDALKHEHFINKQHYAVVLRGIAFIYNQLEKIDKADEYYKKAIGFCEEECEEDYGIKDILISIYQSALDFYKRIMDHDMEKEIENKLDALNDGEGIIS